MLSQQSKRRKGRKTYKLSSKDGKPKDGRVKLAVEKTDKRKDAKVKLERRKTKRRIS